MDEDRGKMQNDQETGVVARVGRRCTFAWEFRESESKDD